MGIKVTLTDTAQIAMDSMGTGAAILLPYDNNMLYLPLPDAPAYPGTDDFTGGDETDISAEKKEAKSRL